MESAVGHARTAFVMYPHALHPARMLNVAMMDAEEVVGPVRMGRSAGSLGPVNNLVTPLAMGCLVVMTAVEAVVGNALWKRPVLLGSALIVCPHVMGKSAVVMGVVVLVENAVMQNSV